MPLSRPPRLIELHRDAQQQLQRDPLPTGPSPTTTTTTVSKTCTGRLPALLDAGPMAAPTSVATACARCYVGATSSALLSYTQEVIETIEVSVQPYVTIFADGSARTSYSTTTFALDIVPTSGSPASTYSNPSDITWTYGAETLTYPTTYVSYEAFARAPAPTAAENACAAPTSPTPIALPPDVHTASLIYPLPANATALAVPGALLDYLDSLPDITGQISGTPLTACAPLSSAAPAIASTVAPDPAGTRPAKRRTPPDITPLAQFPGLRVRAAPPPSGYNATNASPHGNYTTLTANETLTTVAPEPTSTAPYQTFSQGSSVQSTVGASGAPAESHATAYLITTVTGRAIVTAAASTASSTSPVAVVVKPSDGASGSHDGGSSNTGGSSNSGGSSNNGDSSDSAGSSNDGGSASHDGGSSGSSNHGTGDSGHDNTGSGGVGGKLVSLLHAMHRPTPTPAPVFTVGSSTLSPNAAGQYVYRGETFTPGSPIVAGTGHAFTAIVLQTTGDSTQLIVGGSIQTGLPAWVIAPAGGAAPTAVFTADGRTVTAICGSSAVVLAAASSTITLAAGSATTFDRQTISAAPDGGLTINGQTITPAPARATGAIFTANGATITASERGDTVHLVDGAASPTRGIGDYIKSGLGSTASGGGTSATGGAGAGATAGVANSAAGSGAVGGRGWAVLAMALGFVMSG